jgi:hypothetical protein
MPEAKVEGPSSDSDLTAYKPYGAIVNAELLKSFSRASPGHRNARQQ